MFTSIDGTYIHKDPVLLGIYSRACDKFFDVAGDRIVFQDAAEYIYKQLIYKKQNAYEHGLSILCEVCAKIGEDFVAGCEYACPHPTCQRDIHFAVFNL